MRVSLAPATDVALRCGTVRTERSVVVVRAGTRSRCVLVASTAHGEIAEWEMVPRKRALHHLGSNVYGYSKNERAGRHDSGRIDIFQQLFLHLGPRTVAPVRSYMPNFTRGTGMPGRREWIDRYVAGLTCRGGGGHVAEK